MRYTVTDDDNRAIGFYELNPFPGCNQMVISNHAFIMEEARGKGLGKAAHAKRIAEAKRLGYDCMICTVNQYNTPQINIMDFYGWSQVFSFLNKETGSDIHVYFLDLNKF